VLNWLNQSATVLGEKNGDAPVAPVARACCTLVRISRVALLDIAAQLSRKRVRAGFEGRSYYTGVRDRHTAE